VGLRLVLQVPAGVDYDLYVNGSCSCGPSGCRSINGTGVTDEVVAYCNDGTGDDSFTANVEVRYYNGASCSLWTLSVFAGGC
jgi:hypothetical protein